MDRCGAARLRVDRGPAGSAAPFQNFLNYGDARVSARHARLSGADRVEADEPDVRRDVLALGAAGVDGRAAADGHERQREPRAVHAAGRAQDRLRRDGDGAARARRHPRTAALRRRDRRRSGPRLLPDRHRSVRGAAGHQLRPDGGRARDRGQRAVRLSWLGGAVMRPRAGRPRARRPLQARRPQRAAAEQVRQPADRRALRQRRGRDGHQRRQLASAGSFWSARTCTGPLHDNTIATASPATTAALLSAARCRRCRCRRSIPRRRTATRAG